MTQNGTYTFTMSPSLDNHVDSVTIGGGSPIATSYDSRGNVTGALGENIFFDSLDRLYRSKNDLVGDFTFLHNGAGERVLKFNSDFTVLRREMARYIAEANDGVTAGCGLKQTPLVRAPQRQSVRKACCSSL